MDFANKVKDFSPQYARKGLVARNFYLLKTPTIRGVKDRTHNKHHYYFQGYDKKKRWSLIHQQQPLPINHLLFLQGTPVIVGLVARGFGQWSGAMSLIGHRNISRKNRDKMDVFIVSTSFSVMDASSLGK
ncbi:hypothetical protein TNIN_345701 [Trichonephila inaurata madagascariensis]|uniref:Uncharacterized protein n=1 Tax=Trichonephila inaurata madagascariensis TaxID=2747483 RepID=A0A8X6YS97_9ARAC|nr:hypothetical protein TNIN_345701 [Trichonephila inaurata madagascariensis]